MLHLQTFALKQVIRNSSIDYIDYGKIGNNQDDDDTLKPIDIGVKFGISINLEKIVLRSSAAFGISNTRPGGGGGNSVKNISTQFLIGFPIYLFDDKIKKKALEDVEQNGIVFIDEIDKITSRSEKTGADVSREGVQRDLLA